MRFATQAIHVGQQPDSEYGSVAMPIFQTSTYVWKGLEANPEYQYARSGHPNSTALASAIASLEHAKFGIVCASGMAAIAGALSTLQSGDHLLVAEDIYGGTFSYAYRELTRQGIGVSNFDSRNLQNLNPPSNCKMTIFESPSNPTLKVCDIAKVAEEFKKRNIITVFDNTFASPMLQNPLDLGVDCVVHSSTKYIGGHSDLLGGAILTNHSSLSERAHQFISSVGAQAPPFESWLALRGLKTLALRMSQHCANAITIAQYLHQHPKVELVNYPGLPSHPDHELAKSQMKWFGGMLSFAVKGTAEEALNVANRLRVFTLAPSLGGVESLVGYPTQMSHKLMSQEERLKKGVTDNLLRMSVGIEDIEDLLEDLDQALS